MFKRFSLPFEVFLKRKQFAFLATLVGGITVIVVGVLIVFLKAETTPLEKQSEKKTEITSGSKRVKPQEVWVQRLESQLEVSLKRLDNLEKLLDQLLRINQPGSLETKGDGKFENFSQENPNNSSSSADIKGLRQQLAVSVGSLQNKEGKGGQLITSSTSPQHNSQAQNPIPYSFPLQASTNSPQPFDSVQPVVKPLGLQKISLKLNNAKSNVIRKTQDNTIPAGAFARAVLLGGVDASTSISASSDPRPVLLRVTDAGTLPRKFKSDIKDCHVLASSYGDISSERVFMRLEKLTCTERKTGEISETIVSGYVAGEDGRAGVRGILADRAGDMMRNSLVGGFFSGMAKFLTQTQNPLTFTPVAPFGQVNPLSHEQLLKAGAGQGTSSALERYADFYIKRAEQMQPILQVAAGRQVNIVFTEGTAFGETAYKNAYSKVRDRRRQETVRDLSQNHDSSHEVRSSDMQALIPSQQDLKP